MRAASARRAGLPGLHLAVVARLDSPAGGPIPAIVRGPGQPRAVAVPGRADRGGEGVRERRAGHLRGPVRGGGVFGAGESAGPEAGRWGQRGPGGQHQPHPERRGQQPVPAARPAQHRAPLVHQHGRGGVQARLLPKQGVPQDLRGAQPRPRGAGGRLRQKARVLGADPVPGSGSCCGLMNSYL
jgi:hypothetical protein